MDETWRTKTGMHKFPIHPPRRSTGDAATHCTRKPISNDHLDFTDVFGGPPRTQLSHQCPTNVYPKSSSMTKFVYEEIFQQPVKVADVMRRNGRSLPEFRIPVQPMRRDDPAHNYVENCFHSDVFGWDDERVKRSRSRSKTSSSSVLSSGELSPHRPPVSRGRNNDISSFALKLRPINLMSGWNSTPMEQEDLRDQKYVPAFAGNQLFYDTENDCPESIMYYPFGSTRRKTSPETISMEPMSNNSFGVSADDLELKSPSSSVSSVYQSEHDQKNIHQMEEEIERHKSMEEEDDETMSYVIEINASEKGEIYEDNGVDEAIAWAKEKFQAYCSESKSKWGGQQCQDEIKPKEVMLNCDQLSEEHTHSSGSQDVQPDKWTAEKESQQSRAQIEMQILDEKIRLWSNGKGSDIRLLLSSLHHILWPNSSWLSIPLMNIMESSQVRKAYQKARLCLHPDKLQQRGATLPQRYIADNVFSILQDAWDSFIAQDS